MEYLQYLDQLAHEYSGDIVLNLVINGIPSILNNAHPNKFNDDLVLNLVINGIPSIL